MFQVRGGRVTSRIAVALTEFNQIYNQKFQHFRNFSPLKQIKRGSFIFNLSSKSYKKKHFNLFVVLIICAIILLIYL